MNEIASLTGQEKMFLAGAIKAMLLAGGSPSQEQLDDLDRIVEGLGFTDFDEHLERFEADAPGEADFEFLARNMFHAPAKTLITRILWDLALQKGYANPDQEDLIRNLREWWKE